MTEYYEIVIQGIVQGVGFRPFVKNLADSYGLNGTVFNTSCGVTVRFIALPETAMKFADDIKLSAPPLSHILTLEMSETDGKLEYKGFTISHSTASHGVTLASPDTAVCAECIAEISNPSAMRHMYPFTNCTNCGPRYSIMQSLPYDRANTTMSGFHMCEACTTEYRNSSDRRFHAQPIACPECGPSLTLNYHGTYFYGRDALAKAAAAVDAGELIAMKGLGGYHLVCDARNTEAIMRLRTLKERPTKPLAVMCRSVEVLEKYATISDKCRRLIDSAESPVVIFDWHSHPLSRAINPTGTKIGVMKAYTPLHWLLLELLDTEFIVATSGNMKDEPIAIDEAEAEESLKIYTDIFLHHDRPIHNRVDDSVVAMTEHSYTLLRRARGFAPFPVTLCSQRDVEVFAAGANLKSGMAFYKDGFAFLSQYIGDLDNTATEKFYGEVYERLKGLFGVTPSVAVRDTHPTYRSSLFAESLNIETATVQHHVAHFCSCLAENSFYADALGVVLDGFGLGADGTSGWGGEFFMKRGKSIERVGHLCSFVQPGLDSAAKHPYRMAFSYLYSCGLFERAESFFKETFGVTDNEIELLKYMVDNKVNSIDTTAAGRLFEAVGSLVFGRKSNEYEGELAISLETAVDHEEQGAYCFTHSDFEVDSALAFKGLLEDILSGVPAHTMAARFHNGFAACIAEVCEELCVKSGIVFVALSGGVFQNITLSDLITCTLTKRGITVFTHTKVPSNDGGVALGQLYAFLQNISLK